MLRSERWDHDGAALQKCFSYRESGYVCNVHGESRRRVITAAGSVPTRGVGRSSEIPAFIRECRSLITRWWKARN